jgi:hypothetical protein
MEFENFIHMCKLCNWLYMKENIKIKCHELYRQNKPILEKLCSHLPVLQSSGGTKYTLIHSLKYYIFSDEQIQELQ